MNRSATVERKTRETEIQVTWTLDGTGQAEIATGVGLLDHMLHHVSVHGLFDLRVQARGDLHIDAHHTVEDVALVMGEVLDRALGERRGITRVGHSYVPMDEALARVVVDLSGRGYAVFEGAFDTPQIGALPTSLIPHFFESLAQRGKLNLHAHVLYGRDDHHKAEALFKALGRALAMAVELDARRGETSTKGTLVD